MSTSDDFSDAIREAEFADLPWLYVMGVELFNEKDFFECHEVWEEMWRHAIGDHSRFYQGMIQAAVCYYHWGNANFDGARRLAREAMAKLEGLDDRFLELELGAFRARFSRMTKALDAPKEELRPLPAADVPELVLHIDWEAWKLASENSDF